MHAVLVGLLVGLAVVVVVVEGCTYVEVKYEECGEERVAIGRTMELSYPQRFYDDWTITTHPAGSHDPIWFPEKNGEREYDESNPYGFVSFDVVIGDNNDILHVECGEGMNEFGLTVAAHVLQLSEYQQPVKENNEEGKRNVHYFYFTIWALGHFKTTQELLDALENDVHIVKGHFGDEAVIPRMHYHWAVNDASGHSVVVQYMNGIKTIWDNTKVGMLTNDPPFDYHLWNLNSYANVGPLWADQGMKLQIETPVGPLPNVFSRGYNTKGLPGDFTPQSRFVRTWYLKEIVKFNLDHDLESEDEAIIMTTALMNSVFIPRGAAASEWYSESGKKDENIDFDFAQFTIIKLPHKKEFLYRNYENQNWKRIRLDALSLKVGDEQQFLRVYDGDIGVFDWTHRLMSHGNSHSNDHSSGSDSNNHINNHSSTNSSSTNSSSTNSSSTNSTNNPVEVYDVLEQVDEDLGEDYFSNNLSKDQLEHVKNEEVEVNKQVEVENQGVEVASGLVRRKKRISKAVRSGSGSNEKQPISFWERYFG